MLTFLLQGAEVGEMEAPLPNILFIIVAVVEEAIMVEVEVIAVVWDTQVVEEVALVT